MTEEVFFKDMTSYLAENYPDIYMMVFNRVTGKDFSNLTIFNDRQKEYMFRDKYNFTQGFRMQPN